MEVLVFGRCLQRVICKKLSNIFKKYRNNEDILILDYANYSNKESQWIKKNIKKFDNRFKR